MRRRLNRKVSVVLAICFLTVMAMCLVSCGGSNGKYANSEYIELANQTYKVAPVIKGDEYDPAKCSPVPLHITGVAFNGDPVDEMLLYQGKDGDQIELKRGSYNLKVAGSPISDLGALYKVPEGVIEFCVDDAETVSKLENAQQQDLVGYEPAEGLPNAANTQFATITLTPIPETDITDQLIQETCDTLASYGMDSVNVSEYIQLAKNAKANPQALQPETVTPAA